MNPFVEERQRRGLARVAMAMKLGISYDVLSKLELGFFVGIPRVIAKGLADAGYTPEEVSALERRYREWRTRASESMKAQRA